jgi:hypothetical protein
MRCSDRGRCRRTHGTAHATGTPTLPKLTHRLGFQILGSPEDSRAILWWGSRVLLAASNLGRPPDLHLKTSGWLRLSRASRPRFQCRYLDITCHDLRFIGAGWWTKLIHHSKWQMVDFIAKRKIALCEIRTAFQSGDCSENISMPLPEVHGNHSRVSHYLIIDYQNEVSTTCLPAGLL